MKSESSYSFCEEGSQFRAIPLYHMERLIGRSTFPDRKMIALEEDPDRVADILIEEDLNEFCWSLYFDPNFLIRLFYSGFLPICSDLGPPGDPVYCLLPKLHLERSVIDMSKFQISEKKMKKFKGYLLSSDKNFSRVLDSCLNHHRDHCWLYPPLRNSLQFINSHPHKGLSVQVHSIELSDPIDGRIVAGEIGYTVGTIYTSMTGFHSESGAGSAQLAALGLWLKLKGFDLWDLGMDLAYKRELGAELLSRVEWISKVRTLRKSVPREETLRGEIFLHHLFS